MSEPSVLVVEDDTAIRRGLADALRYAGYRVVDHDNGREAEAALLGQTFDLVLLDVVLPGVGGFELLDEIRRRSPELPVIMVTARGAESDRVKGLRQGADDYVVKPFSAKELLARVEAVLRRSRRGADLTGILTIGERTIDLARCEVRWADGHNRLLSEKEAAILRYLAGCAGRVVTREELLQRVWGLDPKGLETRTVDMHVARLREKLNERGDPENERSDNEAVIVTVRARGYMLSQAVQVRDS